MIQAEELPYPESTKGMKREKEREREVIKEEEEEEMKMDDEKKLYVLLVLGVAQKKLLKKDIY